ncbi:cell division protein FtsL [Palleronia caenipelagi]|nr:cell division protein FtsL [Palleronia caenipelagi]
MRTLMYLLPAVTIMALAFWAYSENYETQGSIAHVRELQRQIGAEHETLSILKAEWAYLNRPDRLRDLVALNFDRLQLLPMQPYHFAETTQIPFPPKPGALLAMDGVTQPEGEQFP